RPSSAMFSRNRRRDSVPSLTRSICLRSSFSFMPVPATGPSPRSVGTHKTKVQQRVSSLRGFYLNSPVPGCCKRLCGALAAQRDQLLGAPELMKAARVARYLYRYVGRVGGELEAGDRVLHCVHGFERNIEHPLRGRVRHRREAQAIDESANTL